MEENIITAEKLEDYSIEELEVKKRICEERLKEISEYSFWLRLSKKLGFDFYKLSFAMMFIGMGIFFAIVVIFMAISLTNPPEQMKEIIPMDLITKSMMIAVFIMLPFMFINSTDKRGPYYSRLKEIKRILRIKKEVANQSSKQNSNGKESEKKEAKKNNVKFEDESDSLEYKRSFSESKMKVVHSVTGLMNNNGGTLRIGVNDKDKKFIGIENDLKLYHNDWDEYQQAISNKLDAHLERSIIPLVQIKKIEIDGKPGCDIITKFSPKPVWITDGKLKQFWVRVNNTTREYKGQEAFDYIYRRWKSKEEIQHKLHNFKEENLSNLKLVDKLNDIGDKHFVPRDLIDRQMKIPNPKRNEWTQEDIQRIKDGGYWIPKEDFSIDYALMLDSTGHMLNRDLIQEIKEYIKVGKDLNLQKSHCQNLIVSRPTIPPNIDEAHGYFTRLHKAKEKCEEIDKLISNELKRVTE